MTTRLHVIVDLDKDDETDGHPKRIPVDDIINTFEAEVEELDLEVDGVIFAIRIAGVGRTAKELAESVALRKSR